MLKNIFTIITGLASLFGFTVGVIIAYFALTSNIETEMKDIIVLLSISLCTLLFSVIFIFAYQFKESNKIKYLPLENHKFKTELKNQSILLYYSAEYLHNISHYFRNLVCEIEDLKEDGDFEQIAINFERFLITLTSNLRSYFSILTEDNCNVTIKLTKYEKNELSKVKTLYRDPISYRKRKKSDIKDNGKKIIYDIDDNTAFKIISSPKFKDTSFLCDDLEKKWKKGQYENKTPGWMSLYNACAVVAINKRIEKNNRKIVGFICIDNDSGNLDNPMVENYLNGIADMLYVLFEKYEKLVKMALKKEIENEKIRIYADWDSSR